MARKFTKYPSKYVKASVCLPFGTAYDITKYAMDYLDRGKKVYIDAGALNDVITGYVVEPGYDRGWTKDYDTVYLTSELGYFGKKINLGEMYKVDCEEYDGNLFIHVGG